MTNRKKTKEEYKISGEKLLTKVKQLIKEGNVRKITIKNEKDKAVLIIPLTWGIIGTVYAPVLAAVGALAAVIGKCTISIEKTQPAKKKKK